jgi:hypothetical protein
MFIAKGELKALKQRISKLPSGRETRFRLRNWRTGRTLLREIYHV